MSSVNLCEPDHARLLLHPAHSQLKSLVRYLRKELDWPVDEEGADDLTFDYEPGELGLDETVAVKVREIKQIRPLADKQPWGIFWIEFEPKRLPVVAMRRICTGALDACGVTASKCFPIEKPCQRNSSRAEWLKEGGGISATHQRGSKPGTRLTQY